MLNDVRFLMDFDKNILIAAFFDTKGGFGFNINWNEFQIFFHFNLEVKPVLTLILFIGLSIIDIVFLIQESDFMILSRIKSCSDVPF